MKKIIFDIEADSIDATRIHCLSYCVYTPSPFPEKQIIKTLTDMEEIKSLLSDPEISTLIGHNIIRYDIPVLEKLLSIKIDKELVDTLAIAWYLYPERNKYGLEEFGKFYNLPKIQISDWQNLSIEEYTKRCERDVEINYLLFFDQIDYLKELYDGKYGKILKYLSFKMDCAKEQEIVKWKLDEDLCTLTLSKLLVLQEEKISKLRTILPDNVKYESKSKPLKMLKRDGTLTVQGRKWLELLRERNLPSDYVGNITLEKERNLGNPTSVPQMKSFLFSLGWKPTMYKYTITKKGQNKVPQIAMNGEICQGIRNLYPICPELENLESLSILNHRIGLLKGFLRDVRDGYLTARITGLTNTLRFQHTEIVNLPAIDKPYGKEIRACLTCEENELLYGCDMTNIEDKTKRHYMYFFDPKYVLEMERPDFDAHLDIALLAGFLTKEQVQAHKEKREDYSSLRKKAKMVNFSAIYGVGAEKMHLTTGMPIEECKNLLDTYWQRNRAVKKVTNSIRTKIVRTQTWLYNPISKFWYSLRVVKDKFSTLNQGSAVYCFDLFLKEFRKEQVGVVCGQVHDEGICRILNTEEQKLLAKQATDKAINEVNRILNLNVKLGYSGQFGKNYSLIH